MYRGIQGVICSTGGYGIMRGTGGYWWVPQIALQVRIVLNGLQVTKGLKNGRVQGTAGHRVLHGTVQGTEGYILHSTLRHRVLQGKQSTEGYMLLKGVGYCRLQGTTGYYRVQGHCTVPMN